MTETGEIMALGVKLQDVTAEAGTSGLATQPDYG